MANRSFMWIAGAVALTAGVVAPGAAAAQDTVAERNAVRAETPWYERFTYSQGPSEQAAGLGPVERRGTPAIRLTPRWGVTVNLSEAERTAAARDEGERAAVGAYYQFTPSVRVGGQVSVGTRREPLVTLPKARDEREAAAGVRLESAFRF